MSRRVGQSRAFLEARPRNSPRLWDFDAGLCCQIVAGSAPPLCFARRCHWLFSVFDLHFVTAHFIDVVAAFILTISGPLFFFLPVLFFFLTGGVASSEPAGNLLGSL